MSTNHKQIKEKNGKLFFCKLFRIIKLFFLMLLREATLESKAAPTNRNSSAFLFHTSKTFSNKTFLDLIFPTKKKKKYNVVETTGCFVNQLSKKYSVYYVFEHLKYCAQINEY